MLDTDQTSSIEEIQIPAGSEMMSGRLYRPLADPDRAVVLHSATGVPRDYYRHFAQWLQPRREWRA